MISEKSRPEELLGELERMQAEQRLMRQSIEELRARAEAAEAASRAKDQFLVTLSHELRTPLNAMLGWAQMLSGDELDAATRARAVGAIERNTKLQAQLIDDLLDLSRIITGKMKVDRRPIHLLPLLSELVDGFCQQALDGGVSLALDLAPVNDLVLGDAARVQQILGNLLANALKFTPRGGRVAVTVETIERRREWISIAVRDNGRGIDPALLPRIFERYCQGEAHGRDLGSVDGLGLGLGIARHLAELHGGMLRAESEGVGTGATFTLELPTLGGDGRRRRSRSPSPAPRAIPWVGPEALRGIEILVVDDEDDARELIATMLSQFGAEVAQASSAAEAHRLVCARRPDVLVSDIAMPSEDGYSLIRRVRAAGGPPLPAIAVTAHATREDRDRAIEAGFDRHLAKPIEASDLIGTVALLVASKHQT